MSRWAGEHWLLDCQVRGKEQPCPTTADKSLLQRREGSEGLVTRPREF